MSLLNGRCYAQGEPVKVTGDKVEYLEAGKRVLATGNVVVLYRDIKMTADRISIDMATKDAEAEGHVVIYQGQSTLEGERVLYNFEKETGQFIKARAHAGNLFGAGKKLERLSRNEVRVEDGYLTTCDSLKPHYKVQSREVIIYLDDRVIARNVVVSMGNMPLVYLPNYSHSLEIADKRPHVSVIPGHDREWGAFALSSWKYQMDENARGNLRLDYRQNLGLAEGLEHNYRLGDFSTGSLFFYTLREQEKNRIDGRNARWRLRHLNRLTLGDSTEGFWEVHKYRDQSFIRDYFTKEYEKERSPESQGALSSRRDTHTYNIFLRKRVNRFDDAIQRLPQAEIDIPTQRLSKLPLYYSGNFIASNLSRKSAHSGLDDDAVKLDSYNEASYPASVGLLSIRPYVGTRQGYFSKRSGGEEGIFRNSFTSGIDLSSRLSNTVETDPRFLNLDIYRMRHIITPIVNYRYTHSPSILNDQLFNFDDESLRTSRADLSLENRLLGKTIKKEGGGLKETDVDLARLLLTGAYTFRGQGGSRFANFIGDLELTPKRDFNLNFDTSYNHRSDKFETFNSDMIFTWPKERRFSLGYRYEESQSSNLTSQVAFDIGAKWRTRIYERYEFETGDLREQEYVLERDLHCWLLEITYNIRESQTFWVVFKLKSFPEMPYDINIDYYKPRFGRARTN